MRFGPLYAAAYDALYAAKDYGWECDVVEQAFARFHPAGVQTVLDLGCGTGGHALVLNERGYRVTGVDVSGEMLERARAKAGAVGAEIEWALGDVRDYQPARSYDAVILMFAVLGYMTSNDDWLRALRTARTALAPDGLAVFDVWYGPAVLADPPHGRERAVDVEGLKVTRSGEARLDVRRELCLIDYELRADGVAQPQRETHVVRYVFPMELELMLATVGLELVSLSPFGRFDEDADENAPTVLAVARQTR